jgi:hypothetical protein
MTTDALAAKLTTTREALKTASASQTPVPPDGAILVLLSRGKMLTLNATGAWIVSQLLDSQVELQAVSELFATKFAIDQQQAETDIGSFLVQLQPNL